jgi:hypothetical protein
MLVLSPKPDYKAFSVRPVNKGSDSETIRQVFHKELYGDDPRRFPDESLLNIYDKMDTRDIWGAYLAFYNDHFLFLLEVHPPLQMDLPEEYPLEGNDVGIYCFSTSFDEPEKEPALSACLDTLLDHPGINRVVTSIGYTGPEDPKAAFLKKAGFTELTGSTDKLSVYECTRESLQAKRAIL